MQIDHAIAKLAEYIARGRELAASDDYWLLRGEHAAEYRYWATRLLTLLRSLLPTQAAYYEEAARLAKSAHRNGGIFKQDLLMLVAHLEAIRDSIAAGETVDFERRISADDFREFLDFASAFQADGRLPQAAVVASSVFEASVRRLARQNGIDHRQKLELLINALKSSGAITKLSSKKMKVHADTRSAAFHASYEEFGSDDVSRLIGDTRELLESLGKG